jgi:hypothetical protein
MGFLVCNTSLQYKLFFGYLVPSALSGAFLIATTRSSASGISKFENILLPCTSFRYARTESTIHLSYRCLISLIFSGVAYSLLTKQWLISIKQVFDSIRLFFKKSNFSESPFHKALSTGKALAINITKAQVINRYEALSFDDKIRYSQANKLKVSNVYSTADLVNRLEIACFFLCQYAPQHLFIVSRILIKSSPGKLVKVKHYTSRICSDGSAVNK